MEQVSSLHLWNRSSHCAFAHRSNLGVASAHDQGRGRMLPAQGFLLHLGHMHKCRSLGLNQERRVLRGQAVQILWLCFQRSVA